ncbi:2-succinyl-5-enolpyruvyl-6-hydroxy-3-cyclohexene-1-carboxylic-acid synthase [Candidatus Marinimicrobia bacterium]|nr:2-succinyl-5-enolpyruvyl-6-hydroxy-3-cyclohexene-1-carboxylic-acid synthase [Candidatus Neomarinimicrobiota bacterium]
MGDYVNSVALKNTQHIYDLVMLCAEFGVEKAVVCPGSRCAPLLIGFGMHPDIETISVTDERSAGFVGLGLAQQSGKPVVLVCTSGTAAQNFAPAVTEAFYQQVPLIVLTADRPSEWIDQWDGQTICQNNLYVDHVKGSFVYDKENTDVAEIALNMALDGGQGPMHLNIPIREPFYLDGLDEIKFPAKHTKDTKKDLIVAKGTCLRSTTDGQAKFAKEKNYKFKESVWDEFESILESSEKVMVLGGQMEPNSKLVEGLNKLDVTVVGDVISNLHGVDGVIYSSDLLFKNCLATSLPAGTAKSTKFTKDLKPDFLMTFGRSVISKNLKLFLRKNKPKIHWHIGEGMVGDPFQSLSRIIEVEPIEFFNKWVNGLNTETPKQVGDASTQSTQRKNIIAILRLRSEQEKDTKSKKNKYLTLLLDAQKQVDAKYHSILGESEFNYFSAVKKVIQDLPKNSVLHLGNSMPVRIANFVGLKDSTIDVWSNRGTSGIDGVVSTAVGHALAEPNQKHTLIIGDLSFFYDRNGLWLNHEFPTNLKIVILNDSGGGIFNMIPGPSAQGEITKLFTTPHNRRAELTAQEFGLDYRSASSLEEITGWHSGILEIFTDMKTNTETFKNLTTETPDHGEK